MTADSTWEPNLRQLADHVRFGTLDYLLLKPASVQFLISFRRFKPVSWIDCCWGLSLVGVAVGAHRGVPRVADVLVFVVTLAAAVATVYGIGLTLMALVLWTVQWQGLDDLMRGLFEVGRFPVDFYGGLVARIFTVVLPVAVMTVMPARALLGTLSGTAIVGAVATGTLVLVGSALVWRAAVRTYSGASS